MLKPSKKRLLLSPCYVVVLLVSKVVDYLSYLFLWTLICRESM